MAQQIERIDWGAARNRLASVTEEPDVLAGLDRLRESGTFSDAFMAAVVHLDISLDWLLLGEGGPRRKY